MNQGRIRRFSKWQVINHSFMMFCFIVLVLTGLPQKYPHENWAKGLILLFGGVERTRWLHHLFGTFMALHLLVHLVDLLWLHLVRRYPMTMLPRLQDLRDFLHQVRFNLGLEREAPRMGRYTFAEKIEYLALLWGTVLMVATGLVLLYPIRWGNIIGGEAVIALKTAHGAEAVLAVLSVIIWHGYFVHLRHFNKAMFTGYLEESEYAHEHPLELEQIRRGEQPAFAPITTARLILFALLALALVGGSAMLFIWLRWTPMAG